MRNLNVRDGFFDFDIWAAEESDKVENYRFLESGPYDLDENLPHRTTLDGLSPRIPGFSEKPVITGKSVFSCPLELGI